MATIYYRSVPCDVYEVLQAHDAPPRELYLWCSLGPKAQRTHLVRFHPRTVRHLCDDVADALAQLAEDGLVVYEKTGLTWTVFLAGNAEYLYPKDWGTREGWINDSASDPDSEPKRAMLELLDAKCAKRRPPKADPSQTPPTPLREGRGDTGEERRGKEQEPPTEVVVADAPKKQRAKRKKDPKPESVTQVRDFMREYGKTKGLAVPDAEAENFCDFYENKDWKVSNRAMKDWRLAAQRWVRNSRRTTPLRHSPPPQQAKRKQIWDCETKEEWLALKEAEQPNAPEYTRHAWERHWQAHINDPNNGRTT